MDPASGIVSVLQGIALLLLAVLVVGAQFIAVRLLISEMTKDEQASDDQKK